MRRYSWRTFTRELVLLAVAVVFCVPFYILFVISVKPSLELFTSPMSFPTDPAWSNYQSAWDQSTRVSMGQAMINSLIITAGTVICLIVVGSLCAYTIARRRSVLSTTLYFLFVLGIVIPFQLGIVPLYVAFRNLGLVGSYLGMIILWTGVATPVSVFLYTGFIRALPPDYEEAARVDGASTLRVFVRVVFPLLRPVTVTVAILTGLFVWNDFFVSLIFLGGSTRQTLPVSIYSFVGEFATQWNFVFASIVLALLPIMAFFVLAQRQLIEGFSGGIRG
jgi:raffinose/stachyose/melibiose transport system permease protein